MPVRIGINGLGRIGRAILRITLANPNCEVVAINDINPDINNMAYLIKYDSTYGRLAENVEVENGNICINKNLKIKTFHQPHIEDVPWSSKQVDIVIDASGVKRNLQFAKKIKDQGVKFCVVTNSPDAVDKTIIIGVNESSIDPENDFIISSSICDANAFVPAANILEKFFGIDHGFLTTLHPWLSYQNLLDGPSISYATPGEIHDHYALGRASVGNLIPKTTSAISASCKVLKSIEGKFLSLSYRIPTAVVSTADISVKLKKKTSAAEIKEIFKQEEGKQNFKIFCNSEEALISADFAQNDYSCILDHRWIMVNDQNYAKLILWYDNEWGYSSRVVDLVCYLQHVLSQKSYSQEKEVVQVS